MDKQRKAFFEELMSARSPSGFEEQAQEIVRQRLATAADDVRTDVHGNVLGGMNTRAALRVMLAGHVDEIGLMISHIDDKGYLYFQPIGGVEAAVLIGQKVIVQGAGGPVTGVIGRKAIHLLTEEERKIPVKVEDLFIDIGAPDGKAAGRKVRVSDPATIDASLAYLMNDCAASRGFDDRIGAFVVVETLLEVARRRPRVAVWAACTVQEEVGLRGARTSAFGLDPHVGIAVDVGHASDYPNMDRDKRKVGDIRLGLGPILCRGPNINPVVIAGLEAVAKARRIPTQFQAEPRATGTDANAIQVNRSGVAAGLVSIPNRYMHTPVEVVNLRDVENAIRLLAEYVVSLKPTDTFIPGVSQKRKRR